MNAPKSGLFALTLFISFIIHGLLIITAGQDVLQQNRMQYKELLMEQLSQESADYLAEHNFIALGSLAERYVTLPGIATLQLYDTEEQQVINVGHYKTQVSNPYTKDVKKNDKVVGHIELTLTQGNYSEIFYAVWVTLFFSMLVHLSIFGTYIVFTRPRRSQYMQYLVTQQQIEQELSDLKQELQHERDQITKILSEYEIHQQVPAESVKAEQLILVIKYFDPNQLMRNLSPVLLKKFFQTCQVMLQHSVVECCRYFNMNPENVLMLESFNQQGAKISIDITTEHATECLTMIQNLSHVLFNTLYEVYRQNKKFALNTRSAIAEASHDSAVETAERLVNQLKPQQKAVFLKHDRLKLITTSYQLTSFENPSNSLIRQSYLVTGVNAETAQILTQLRTQILHISQ